MQELELKRRCCNCESSDSVISIEFELREPLEGLFQKPMKGFICKICVDVAKSSDIDFEVDDGLGPLPSGRKLSGSWGTSNKKETTTRKDVNILGEWTCRQCNQSNSAYAKVCDKCSKQRDEASKGEEFPLQLGGVGDELGLCLEILNGSIRIVNIIENSLAFISDIPKGILTMIDNQSVNSSGELRRIADIAKKNGKKTIMLRIVSQTLKPSELVSKKSKLATPPAVPIAPRTPPTGWTLPPAQAPVESKPNPQSVRPTTFPNPTFPNPTFPAQPQQQQQQQPASQNLFTQSAQTGSNTSGSLFPTPTPAAPPPSSGNSLFPTPSPVAQPSSTGVTASNTLFPAQTASQPAQNMFAQAPQQQQQQQQPADLFQPNNPPPKTNGM